jgi:hypothetical protein
MFVDDMARVLVDAGVGAVGTDIFLFRLPEDPDSCVAIYEAGGRPRQVTHDGSVRRFPQFQVAARDPDPVAARQKAEAVWRAYNGFLQAVVNGTVYEVIVPLGEPFSLTHDTSRRYIFAANYEARWQS